MDSQIYLKIHILPIFAEFLAADHMKLSALLLPVVIAFLSCPVICASRTLSGEGADARYPSFDRSIFMLRCNALGDIRYHYDDYIQYSPAVVMAGLKACGYESRSSWGRMLVSDAFSVALMAAAVNGIKYTVARQRPDGSARNSFPSGHTATSFMAAAMLHEEYGWRSPWFSFGGYAIAAATGVSRIINNRHWATDVIAGAAIGILSVKLGYFFTDLIFKEKYINGMYREPVIGFDSSKAYYEMGLYLGYRFFLGGAGLSGDNGNLMGGGTSGIEISFPVSCSGALRGTAGVALRAGSNSYIADSSLSFNTYDFMAGGYWRHPFARILEVDTRVFAGYSLAGNRPLSETAGVLDGFALSAGGGLAVAAGENFKIKAMVEYGASNFSSRRQAVHSLVLGGSALFFW